MSTVNQFHMLMPDDTGPIPKDFIATALADYFSLAEEGGAHDALPDEWSELGVDMLRWVEARWRQRDLLT